MVYSVFFVVNVIAFLPFTFGLGEIGNGQLSTHNSLADTRFKRLTNSSSSNCDGSQYACNDGSCISLSNRCDGIKHCTDGSDETKLSCENFECSINGFRCSYGACVNETAKCNGTNECADASDENESICPDKKLLLRAGAPCRKSEFTCKSGMCITEYSLCDGTLDCNDGSDETAAQCENNQCPGYVFRCTYGACIDITGRCDGIKQCADGSDESSLICQRSTPPSTPTRTNPPRRTPATPTASTRPSVTQASVTEHTRPSKDNSCQIPPYVSGTMYKVQCDDGAVQDRICRAQSGEFVPQFTTLSITCDHGYIQNNTNDPTVMAFCLAKSWTPPINHCLKTCRKLSPQNMEIMCTYSGKDVDCYQPMRPSTQVRYNCLPGYVFQGSTPPDDSYIECLENGDWSDPLYKCIPECGVPFIDALPLIAGGVNASYGDSPWHVAIYDVTTYTLICGGTIISPYLIVSAAHCFVNTASARRNASNFEIAVSKFSRDYNRQNDNADTQIYKIRQIYMPSGYRGLVTHHANDVAVLETTVKIILKPTVRTACRWTSTRRFNPSPGTNGKVVGWGVDDSGSAAGSPTLLATVLPYVGYDDCLNIVPDDFKPYITTDKFCAGNVTGPGVKQGDSGGGLMFKLNNLYYLIGVVSIKSVNTTISIAAFTDLSYNYHLDWIDQIKNSVEKRIILEEDTTIPLREGGGGSKFPNRG